MLIGDAAQLINPFSGEGIANAMLSGKLAAEHAVEALHSGTVHSGGLASYESAVWDELGEELDTAYRLQRLLLNRGARWLLDTLVHRAAKRPRVREALVDMMVHGELGQLTNPLVCAKLLLEWPFGPSRMRSERRPLDVAGARSRP
jgi:flavin-dependent dehydrogenase